jgi:uncharacterized protein DUF4167
MKNISELKPVMAQPRPNAKPMTKAKPQRRRSNERSGLPRPQAKNSQNAATNYQRYLALARAEALRGDRVAAENYFQHAEHYFRSMGNAN